MIVASIETYHAYFRCSKVWRTNNYKVIYIIVTTNQTMKWIGGSYNDVLETLILHSAVRVYKELYVS